MSNAKLAAKCLIYCNIKMTGSYFCQTIGRRSGQSDFEKLKKWFHIRNPKIYTFLNLENSYDWSSFEATIKEAVSGFYLSELQRAGFGKLSEAKDRIRLYTTSFSKNDVEKAFLLFYEGRRYVFARTHMKSDFISDRDNYPDEREIYFGEEVMNDFLKGPRNLFANNAKLAKEIDQKDREEGINTAMIESERNLSLFMPEEFKSKFSFASNFSIGRNNSVNFKSIVKF